jgi:hypothetical protein
MGATFQKGGSLVQNFTNVLQYDQGTNSCALRTASDTHSGHN